MIVDILYKEIDLTKTASINEVVDLVAKWKENWLVICDLVADVNDFIGRPLFLYIIYGLSLFIFCTMTLALHLLTIESESFEIMAIYIILRFLISFCLLAFEAEKLPSKVNCWIKIATGWTIMNRVFNFQVSNISKQLRHVKVSVYAIQNQVSLS